MLEDVVQPLLAIWDLLLQPIVEAFHDLSQKHAGLAAGIEKPHLLVAPEVCRKHVENPIHQSRWRKNLVTAQVRDTAENVGVVVTRQHGRSP